jgi:hypothetical protein
MSANIPFYGSNKDGGFLGGKAGRVIETDGATNVSLSAADAGSIVVIAGGVNGACAISLPAGENGMTFEFYLKAANGTGDCDIDAKDVTNGTHDYFLGMITHHEADADTNTPFAASTNDQLTLVASKGDVGDYMKITWAAGHWMLTGHTGDADGWVVGTASANNSV